MKISYNLTRNDKRLASVYVRNKYLFIDEATTTKNLDNFCFAANTYFVHVPYSFYCRRDFKWRSGMSTVNFHNFEKMVNFSLNAKEYKEKDKDILKVKLGTIKEQLK